MAERGGGGDGGVPPIRTPRLDLVSLSPEVIEALFGGRLEEASDLLGAEVTPEWAAEARRTLGYRRRQLADDPSLRPWLLRAMVARAPASVAVGRIGFHGAPDAGGAVEVGYAVLPGHRRQGYAEEAVRALFDWARREHGVGRFVASVGPRNAPSLGLVRKLGFRETGVRWDEEDGEELVFELG
jgi:ribosomal-protein-alanine N-acetyltransferase